MDQKTLDCDKHFIDEQNSNPESITNLLNQLIKHQSLIQNLAAIEKRNVEQTEEQKTFYNTVSKLFYDGYLSRMQSDFFKNKLEPLKGKAHNFMGSVKNNKIAELDVYTNQLDFNKLTEAFE